MDEIQFLLDPVESIEDAGRLWSGLEKNGESSFFVSWTWIGTWLRSLPRHVRPQLLTARRGRDAIGAAIFIPRQERRRAVLNVRQLHFNSTGDAALDSIWIEHNGFVGRAGTLHDLWPAFLRWFATEADADELLVQRTGDSLTVDRPRELKLLHTTNASPAFRSALLPGGMEAILASLSANTRQHLRRSLRACEALGKLRCEAAGSVETALSWFDALKAMHVASWDRRGRPHAFRHPFAEKFHRALIARGVPEGSVRLLRISAGPTALGYLYNFRRGETVYAYQSGFDYAREELRPGYVSHLLAMAMSADEGASRYDFLAGDNQLKRSLAAEHYALSSHRLAKPTPGMRIEAAARSIREKLGL